MRKCELCIRPSSGQLPLLAPNSKKELKAAVWKRIISRIAASNAPVCIEH